MEAVAFSQNDRKWKGEKLLGSLLTIGNYGCLITTYAVILRFYGWLTTPKMLNELLINNGGANKLGLYDWGLVAKIYGGTEEITDARGRRLKDTELKTLKEAIRIAPVSIQVDMKPATEASDMHFVVGYEVLGDDIKIVDPWNGEKTTILKKYAKYGWDLQRAIERFSIVRVPFKEGAEPEKPPTDNTEVIELRKENKELETKLEKAEDKLKEIVKIAK